MGYTFCELHLAFLCPYPECLIHPVHSNTVSHNEYCQSRGYYWNILLTIEDRWITLCLIPWCKCSLLSEVVCIVFEVFVWLWSVPLSVVLHNNNSALLLSPKSVLIPYMVNRMNEKVIYWTQQLILYIYIYCTETKKKVNLALLVMNRPETLHSHPAPLKHTALCVWRWHPLSIHSA